MDGIDDETIRLRSPSFTDELVGRGSLECLEPSSEIIGVDEVCEMLFELFVIAVMEALDGRVLDGPVHSLDSSSGPWMLHLDQPVFDIVLVTDAVEDVIEGVAIASPICELNAIVYQNRMDGIGHSID